MRTSKYQKRMIEANRPITPLDASTRVARPPRVRRPMLRGVGIVVAVVAITLMLAACGGGGASTNDPDQGGADSSALGAASELDATSGAAASGATTAPPAADTTSLAASPSAPTTTTGTDPVDRHDDAAVIAILTSTENWAGVKLPQQFAECFAAEARGLVSPDAAVAVLVESGDPTMAVAAAANLQLGDVERQALADAVFSCTSDRALRAFAVSIAPSGFVAGASSCSASDRSDVESETRAAILGRGTINVGVGAVIGLPTDFERSLAEELFGRLLPGVEIVWVEVSNSDRFAALATGEVDVLMAMSVHSRARDADAQWTCPYLLGGVAVIASADIDTIEDLREKTVAVDPFHRMHQIVVGALAGYDVSVEALVGPADHAVASGAADAAAASWVNAIHRVSQLGPAAGLNVVMIDAYHDPIAIAAPLGDPRFRNELERTLADVIGDGTWDFLFESTFGFAAPWSAAEMATVGAP